MRLFHVHFQNFKEVKKMQTLQQNHQIVKILAELQLEPPKSNAAITTTLELTNFIDKQSCVKKDELIKLVGCKWESCITLLNLIDRKIDTHRIHDRFNLATSFNTYCGKEQRFVYCSSLTVFGKCYRFMWMCARGFDEIYSGSEKDARPQLVCFIVNNNMYGVRNWIADHVAAPLVEKYKEAISNPKFKIPSNQRRVWCFYDSSEWDFAADVCEFQRFISTVDLFKLKKIMSERMKNVIINEITRYYQSNEKRLAIELRCLIQTSISRDLLKTEIREFITTMQQFFAQNIIFGDV